MSFLIHFQNLLIHTHTHTHTTYRMHIPRFIRVTKPVCTRRSPGPKFHKQAYHFTCEVAELQVVLFCSLSGKSSVLNKQNPTAGMPCIYRKTCSSLSLEMVFKTHTDTEVNLDKFRSQRPGVLRYESYTWPSQIQDN